MKDQTKKLITTSATVLVVLSVCLFAGKNGSESSEPMTVADVSIAATSKEETEKTGEITVTKTEEGPTSSQEQQDSAVGNESGHNRASTETGNETTPENTEKTHTEESSSESDRGIYYSKNGIYGDTGERIFYRCDKERFWYLILKLGDPQWYPSGESQEYYEKVFALSKRYTTEHPFSEGSILKPYFQNIEYVFPFVSDYETREVVVKAYDISGTKKYFLIEFTITDNYELDTVTVRELADDEVVE